MKQKYRTWMEIDLDQIQRNYKAILDHLPTGCRIMAVVKANAYGLDAVPITLALEEAGCSFFSVNFLEEAVRLREAGIKAEILINTPIELDEAIVAAELDVTITLSDVESSQELSVHLEELGVDLKAHLKLDSGLSRFGLVLTGREEEALQEAEELMRLPRLHVNGVYTHIVAANTATPGGDDLNRRQLASFMSASNKLLARGHTLIRHCLSSGPSSHYLEEYACDYIRIGSLLFGAGGAELSTYKGFVIDNSVSLKTKIIQIKNIPAGSCVGYGPLFTALRDTRVAVVPFGFADGLRRSLSNNGSMMLHGQWAPIIGKICCDHTMLDVTDIPNAKRGDVVTVFGQNGNMEQTAGHYAAQIGATSAEITAIFSERIPRIPIKGGIPQK